MKHALVAQRIEHLTTDQKVRGSNPFERTESTLFFIERMKTLLNAGSYRLNQPPALGTPKSKIRFFLFFI